jgi:hypothetical protein
MLKSEEPVKVLAYCVRDRCQIGESFHDPSSLLRRNRSRKQVGGDQPTEGWCEKR